MPTSAISLLRRYRCANSMLSAVVSSPHHCTFVKRAGIGKFQCKYLIRGQIDIILWVARPDFLVAMYCNNISGRNVVFLKSLSKASNEGNRHKINSLTGGA